MSAGYGNPAVQFDAASRRAVLEFEVRNESAETWRASEGFAIGYHLFDAETGTLIVDGPRVQPERDLKPGERWPVRLAFDVPAEAGRYQIIASPMREGVCWYYERNWPFVLVEAVTGDPGSRIDSARVSTLSAMRRARGLRAIGRAFVYPVLTVWKNRGLIRVMVRRDILGRYRGSFGGSFWTVFSPLLLMLTYFFVFGVVLDSRLENDNSRSGFALYYLAGMLPWLAFSEAAGRAPSVILEHRNFVKKLVFAVETLPVNLVAAGLVTEVFAILLYSLFLLAIRGHLPLAMLWLPAVIVPQVLFTAGISWFLAALGAYVRDLGQIISFVLTVWFFITPICYSEARLKVTAPFLSKNPIYVLVRGYRNIFLEGRAPDFGPLWKLWLLGVILFVLGHAWFYKLRKSFPDVV